MVSPPEKKLAQLRHVIVSKPDAARIDLSRESRVGQRKQAIGEQCVHFAEAAD
jgi:hypothetical protein